MMDDEAVHSIHVIWMIGNGGLPKAVPSANLPTLLENIVEPEMTEMLIIPTMETEDDGDGAIAPMEENRLADHEEDDSHGDGIFCDDDIEPEPEQLQTSEAELYCLRPTDNVGDTFSSFLDNLGNNRKGPRAAAPAEYL